MKTFSEGLQTNLQKLAMKLDNFKTDTLGNIAATKEEMKEKIELMDKYYQETIIEQMSADIESVRIMARDSVNAKEKELTELMNKQVKTIQTFVNENIEDMVQERKATLSKYEKQFNQIKLVCCKYFEKYDLELETVKIKTQNVMDKYNDWSKVLIEPASMNDARLFSLESRVHEEEEIRIKEYEFIRDLMKKLIYSFE
jgi:enoyl reductase-like protein